MQQLQSASHGISSAASCASEILDAVPAVLQFIRAQIWRHSGPDLSVPQFRTLAFLNRTPGTSLSALAEFLGLSLPATSRLVEGLVRKGFVERRIPEGNRRIVALSLSTNGLKTVHAARKAAEIRLAEVVASLPARERAAIQRAMRTLREKVQFQPKETDPLQSLPSRPSLKRRKQ